MSRSERLFLGIWPRVLGIWRVFLGCSRVTAISTVLPQGMKKTDDSRAPSVTWLVDLADVPVRSKRKGRRYRTPLASLGHRLLVGVRTPANMAKAATVKLCFHVERSFDRRLQARPVMALRR